MKIITALLFVAIGIFLAFRYPDTAASVYEYLDIAWNWIVVQFNSAR